MTGSPEAVKSGEERQRSRDAGRVEAEAREGRQWSSDDGSEKSASREI